DRQLVEEMRGHLVAREAQRHASAHRLLPALHDRQPIVEDRTLLIGEMPIVERSDVGALRATEPRIGVLAHEPFAFAAGSRPALLRQTAARKAWAKPANVSLAPA